jgi:hypothetical protein
VSTKAQNSGRRTDCEYARNKDPTPETHQHLEIIRDVLTLVGSLCARNVTPPKKSNSPHNQITCPPVQWGHAWEQFHKPDTKREILTPDEREKFYEFFERNRDGFGKATQPIEEEASHAHPGSRSSLTKLREFVKIVRKDSRMTDFDLDFLNDVLDALETGVIPKNDAKKIVEKIESAGNDILKYLSALREGVKPAYLGKNTKQDAAHDRKEKREIVLSLYRKAG